MYHGIAVFADAGVNVIVDEVIFDPNVLRVAAEELADSDVHFVGLHLPLDVAEQRERQRGDRGPGGAAAWHHLVHAHGLYDLELDTSAATAMECAQAIRQALIDGIPRRAVSELARQFAG